MTTPGYFAVIPANVRYSRCAPNAKLLYGEITALCNREGYCWATNAYFANLYNVQAAAISDWIRQLSKAGFIRFEIDRSEKGTERKIWLCQIIPAFEGGTNKPTEGGGKNSPPGAEKAEPNSTVDKDSEEDNGGQAADVPAKAGEKKRRRITDSITQADLAGYVLPPKINTKEVRAALELWRVHVAGKRKTLTRQALAGILTDADDWGPVRFVAAVAYSRRKNWATLFEDKTKFPSTGKNAQSQVVEDRAKSYRTDAERFNELNEAKLTAEDDTTSQYDE